MINVAIVDDNMEYLKSFINYIMEHSEFIRLVNLSNDGNEIIKAIDKNHIELLLLDLKMPNCNGFEVINKISSLSETQRPNVIIITGEQTSISSIQEFPFILDIIYKGSDIKYIFNKLENIAKYYDTSARQEQHKILVMNELLYLGFNIKHKGTQYLYDSIIYILEAEEKSLINNLEKYVYSIIAKKYNKTIFQIKNNIIKAINYMYLESDYYKVKNYFSLYSNNEKPTAKQIISIILSKI